MMRDIQANKTVLFCWMFLGSTGFFCSGVLVGELIGKVTLAVTLLWVVIPFIMAITLKEER